MPKVGLLTTRSHPLLTEFLFQADQQALKDTVLLLDEKDFSDKDRRIFVDRTQSQFPQRELEPFLARYPAYTVDSHNSAACVAKVKELGLELLVNAGTPRKLNADIIGSTSRGILNAHPGILPAYRGASCCEWAIYNDDAVGVTAHFMDEGIDTGPIIFSEELTVSPKYSYVDLRVALYRLAHQVRLRGICEIFAKNLQASMLPAQPDGGRFDPIPDELMAVVKEKLADGSYAASHAQAVTR